MSGTFSNMDGIDGGPLMQSELQARKALGKPIDMPCLKIVLGCLVGFAVGILVAPSGGEIVEAGKPTLCYWPTVAGRGELARLIAVAGGLEIEEVGECSNKASYGSPELLPVLSHGRLKIAQSTAIEDYLAHIAPNWKDLTAAQHAVDSMFMSIKEDVLRGVVQIYHGNESHDRYAPHFQKWFSVIEGRLPDAGFINGHSHPTPADLAVTMMFYSRGPFQYCFNMTGHPLKYPKEFPKMNALTELTVAHPRLSAYLNRSKSFWGRHPPKPEDMHRVNTTASGK
mmetsp:Transcript_85055/g.150393  ORF Transcript_85055/g.150393 Transcript_85055/m.150393 type:complete len:283 (-) Transcript_85055:40-888(-)